ncbi:MAG TPA: CBS domain-containing protein [Kofleriaceae bacterium]|nr:CBS domain-containing protein [Kofleriaceae bacterium]
MAHTVEEVMTRNPKVVGRQCSLQEAAAAMRDCDIGDVLVCDGDRLVGIITDRDIVIRAIADGLPLTSTTVGEICSDKIVELKPGDTIDDAVQLMRDCAVRRVPVCDHDGRVVGIVSLGDLAQAFDPRSALAEISSAPSNG